MKKTIRKARHLLICRGEEEEGHELGGASISKC